MEENKMFLEFKVDRQIINRIDTLKPVEDSVNYLYLHFTFSSDWDGLKKRVTFIRIDGSITSYLDENDNCVVPPYMNQYSGFYVTLVGENEEKQILVTTNKKFVGVTKSGGIEVMDALLRYIETKTLDYKKLGEIAYLEIPNIYGTKLKLLKESGVIQLLGRNENNDEIVLNEIDLPTEKIITNIYYEAEKESLIFQFENNPDIEVPIGDIFELDDYYNEKYGHIETDKVIRGIGSILKQNIRQTDLVGRFGGDEFVILFKNTDLDSCYNRIDSIRKMICSGFYNLRCLNDDKIEKVKVSMTFGISFLQNDIDKCMKEADDALVNGKKVEKNKVYILEK